MWPEKLMSMPPVKAVMTPFPYSIGLQDALAKAAEMMASHKIHHLPVVNEGNLVGVVSHRDILRAMDQRSGDALTALRVADATYQDAYVVDLSEPLDRVLVKMARRRLGATLVTKEGRLAGIFTLTDACRCFAESLRRQFPPPGGDEAA